MRAKARCLSSWMRFSSVVLHSLDTGRKKSDNKVRPTFVFCHTSETKLEGKGV